MKKIMFALVACMMMSASAFAQENVQRKPQQFDKPMTVEQRTQAVVERYNLNEKQAKKLLALNKKYEGKLPQGGMRHHGMRPNGNNQFDRPAPPQNGQFDEKNAPKSTDVQRPEPPKDQMGNRPPMPPRDGKGMNQNKDMEKMKKNHDAYEKKLKKIMGDSTYQRYKQDQKNLHKRGPQQGKAAHHGDKPCCQNGAKQECKK